MTLNSSNRVGLFCAPSVAVLLMSALISIAAEKPPLDTDALLKRIDTGYYGKPDVPLKTNENYAHSSSDVEP